MSDLIYRGTILTIVALPFLYTLKLLTWDEYGNAKRRRALRAKSACHLVLVGKVKL